MSVSSPLPQATLPQPYPTNPSSLCRLRQGANDDSDEDLDDFTFWLFVAISVGLVVIAGLMSGLTLGLMSLDVVDLEVSRGRAYVDRGQELCE